VSERTPEWLVADLLRVEELITQTAGDRAHPLVRDPALHLIGAGGKRLRPALALIASRAGEPGRRETDLAAAALELVHLASLYHDDVLDDTQVRRGAPTVHEKWGTDIAILVGDYLFACGCGLGADAGGEVPGILARAIADVCQGQIVETSTLNDPRRSVADYEDTIRAKTATLFKAAGELGATTAGASEPHRAALRAYGESLGLAFQIVDDLLDLVGDPDITGKEPGTDLKEGVFTLPVLLACERDPDLVELLSSGERGLDAVLPHLKDSGAIDTALDRAREFAGGAKRCLEELPDGDYRITLATVVDGALAQLD
jgi:heptaprenyl diphosphate synthase